MTLLSFSGAFKEVLRFIQRGLAIHKHCLSGESINVSKVFAFKVTA